MFINTSQDVVHKAYLLRTLTEISDNEFLSSVLQFKGGTCAALLQWIDRFSVDLDFDFIGKKEDLPQVHKEFTHVFQKIGLIIKDRSTKTPQYFLKYPAKTDMRNTLKIDVTFPPPQSNKYTKAFFPEIQRFISIQTKETAFAHKLVASKERFLKTGKIAGRDFYDIHRFFFQGFSYSPEVILEREHISDILQFFEEFEAFVEKHLTETLLQQDLNTLLPPNLLKHSVKYLKPEICLFLKAEKKRIKG